MPAFGITCYYAVRGRERSVHMDERASTAVYYRHYIIFRLVWACLVGGRGGCDGERSLNMHIFFISLPPGRRTAMPLYMHACLYEQPTQQ